MCVCACVCECYAITRTRSTYMYIMTYISPCDQSLIDVARSLGLGHKLRMLSHRNTLQNMSTIADFTNTRALASLEGTFSTRTPIVFPTVPRENASINPLNQCRTTILKYPTGILIAFCQDTYFTAITGATLILLVGLIGNILTILVTLQPSARKKSFSNLLTALAIADILYSINGCGDILLRAASNDRYSFENIFGCGFFVTIQLISEGVSSQVLCLISVERYLSISFPRRSVGWSTRKRYIMSIVLIVSCNIMFVAPAFFYLININNRFLNPCDSDNFPIIYQITIQILVLFGPIILMSILNVLIMKGLVKNGKNISKLHINKSASARRRAEFRRTLPVLFAVCLAYIVTTAPTGTIHILSSFGHRWTYVDIRTQNPCQFFLSWLIIRLLRLLNHSINFYLYCLTGSKFREELCKLFCRTPASPVTTTANVSNTPVLRMDTTVRENTLSHKVDCVSQI